jgi:hypothetical protein
MKMKSTGLTADLNLNERNVLEALPDNSSVKSVRVRSGEDRLESNLADTDHYTAKLRHLNFLNVLKAVDNFDGQQPYRHWNFAHEG